VLASPSSTRRGRARSRAGQRNLAAELAIVEQQQPGNNVNEDQVQVEGQVNSPPPLARSRSRSRGHSSTSTIPLSQDELLQQLTGLLSPNRPLPPPPPRQSTEQKQPMSAKTALFVGLMAGLLLALVIVSMVMLSAGGEFQPKADTVSTMAIIDELRNASQYISPIYFDPVKHFNTLDPANKTLFLRQALKEMDETLFCTQYDRWYASTAAKLPTDKNVAFPSNTLMLLQHKENLCVLVKFYSQDLNLHMLLTNEYAKYRNGILASSFLWLLNMHFHPSSFVVHQHLMQFARNHPDQFTEFVIQQTSVDTDGHPICDCSGARNEVAEKGHSLNSLWYMITYPFTYTINTVDNGFDKVNLTLKNATAFLWTLIALVVVMAIGIAVACCKCK